MNSLKIGHIQTKFPIIQGGMGVGVSMSGLSSAVANEGGIGIISAAAIGIMGKEHKNAGKANIIALRREIRKARKQTTGYIGVNIMMALTDHEDLIKLSIDEGVDIIILGAGLPLKIPAMLAESGYNDFKTQIAVKVSSAKAAKLIFQFWASRYNRIPDAVVVEGPRAGGHLGFKKEELIGSMVPLKTLIAETVDALSPFEHEFNKEVPVIAAGGIYTGEDIYEIMKAGAKGVKLGTRFVTTHECDASMEFKLSFINCKSEDITLIDSPVGLPGRVIKNEFVQQIMNGATKPFKCEWHCLSSCNFRKAPYCIAVALYNAARGKMADGFAFTGTNGYLASKIQHVSEVFRELTTGYRIALAADTLRLASLRIQTLTV
jgi:NAD(P)H-dependent flavin oxidoreductase YrpB (nitropropane dioxygenase family)